MTQKKRDEKEFEEWIRDCDYHDLDVASMLFVWLASRRLLNIRVKELEKKLQKEIISVNELSLTNQDLNQRVKELEEQHNLFPK